MRIYISSHCKFAAKYVADCAPDGFDVVSTWHCGPFARTADRSEQDRIDGASRNAAQIASADAMVLVASPDSVPGGKFVEAGIAIGLGKPVYVLGRRENNLLWHPLVSAFSEVEDIYAAIRASAGDEG